MDAESSSPIINQCPECSQDIDVTDFAPFSKIICPYCEAAVRVKTRLGQYEIRHLLGEGGMSQVFAADDLTLGRKVALKILHQSLSRDSTLLQMFEREAKLTASINHPNVVKVFTVGHEREYFYIAMELVDAISVDQMIAEQGALPELTVLNLAYDVVSGLRAAFLNNLIHRDIKPGNMLMTHGGTVKLVDFGLAVAQGVADESEDLWATPFYVPPEKLIRDLDTYLGDIYALGATCYHALAGKPPFNADTSSIEELIEIKSAGINLKADAPNASKSVIRLIEQMMAFNATDRPQSYDILLEQIADCQDELGGGSASATAQRASSVGRRKRTRWFLYAGGAGFAVLALLVAINSASKRDDTLESLLLSHSNERVISVEEREAAGKMLAGRNAMVAGDYGEARRIFQELRDNPNFTQPSQGWNTFNEGLVHLLLGDEPAARKTFLELSRQVGFNSEGQKSYGLFFHEIGSLLSEPLPLPRSDFSTHPGSYQNIALLAAGLKNWEQGQFSEAARFFEDFMNSPLPPTEPWIGKLQPLVEPYLADFKVFQSLRNPSVKMSEQELRAIIASLQKADESLQTRAALKKFVKSRIERAENFLTIARQSQPLPSNSLEWTDAEKAELNQLQEMVTSFSDLRETYLFSGAVLRLRPLQLETPKGKALQQDLIDGYSSADRFIEGLVLRLNQGNYQGKVVRKSGLPLDARITAATTENLMVDLGFGPNEVELDQFSPSWLAQAAVATLAPPSNDNLTAWKEAFWFASACGSSTEAASIALNIVAVDQAFKDAGNFRFSKIKF